MDVHNILQVPIGSPETEDRLVWAFSKSGSFTVRSCYHNLLEGNGREETGGVNADTPLWNWIWTIKYLQKCVFFYGKLVTRLYLRGSPNAVTCGDKRLLLSVLKRSGDGGSYFLCLSLLLGDMENGFFPLISQSFFSQLCVGVEMVERSAGGSEFCIGVCYMLELIYGTCRMIWCMGR